jgi:hypothetical protein
MRRAAIVNGSRVRQRQQKNGSEYRERSLPRCWSTAPYPSPELALTSIIFHETIMMDGSRWSKRGLTEVIYIAFGFIKNNPLRDVAK